MFIFYALFAFVAGIGIAFQSVINANLAKDFNGNSLFAAFVSFAVGTLFLLAICLIKGDILAHLAALPKEPLWKLLGGIIGGVFVFAATLLAPKMGVTNMLFFIIIAQLLAAATIDKFGLLNMPIRDISLVKIIGICIVFAGLLIFFFGDKIFAKA